MKGNFVSTVESLVTKQVKSSSWSGSPLIWNIVTVCLSPYTGSEYEYGFSLYSHFTLYLLSSLEVTEQVNWWLSVLVTGKDREDNNNMETEFVYTGVRDKQPCFQKTKARCFLVKKLQEKILTKERREVKHWADRLFRVDNKLKTSNHSFSTQGHRETNNHSHHGEIHSFKLTSQAYFRVRMLEKLETTRQTRGEPFPCLEIKPMTFLI